LLLIAAVLASSHANIARTPPPSPNIELLDLSRDPVGALLDFGHGDSCANGKRYLGIGMQLDLDAVVTKAPTSYPAYLAGIRLGDVVANPEVEPDSAGYDTVEFTRHGRLYRTRVKARWICLR